MTAMPTPTPSTLVTLAKALTVGARVHIYAAAHYNQRGRIVAIDHDPTGTVTVRIDGLPGLVRCHACDLEPV